MAVCQYFRCRPVEIHKTSVSRLEWQTRNVQTVKSIGNGLTSGDSYNLRSFTSRIHRRKALVWKIRIENQIVLRLLVLGTVWLNRARSGLFIPQTVRCPEIWPPLLPDAYPLDLGDVTGGFNPVADRKQKKPDSGSGLHVLSEWILPLDSGLRATQNFLDGSAFL